MQASADKLVNEMRVSFEKLDHYKQDMKQSKL